MKNIKFLPIVLILCTIAAKVTLAPEYDLSYSTLSSDKYYHSSEHFNHYELDGHTVDNSDTENECWIQTSIHSQA